MKASDWRLFLQQITLFLVCFIFLEVNVMKCCFNFYIQSEKEGLLTTTYTTGIPVSTSYTYMYTCSYINFYVKAEKTT